MGRRCSGISKAKRGITVLKKPKYFFEKGTEEFDEPCYNLEHWEEERKTRETDIILEEAKPELNTEYFYCTAHEACGLKEDSDCGNMCESYEPRNGKSGRCRFNHNCYAGTGRYFKLTSDNKLTILSEA